MAAREEIWLHTKDIPGSHVVIRSKILLRKRFLKQLSLLHILVKHEIPVLFRLTSHIRYVKKPAGAKPGFVIYDNQQTVFVTPDEETVLRLKKH